MKKMYFANSITRDVDIKLVTKETQDSVWVYEDRVETCESKLESSNGKFFETELEAWWYLLQIQKDRFRNLNSRANQALENVLEISHKIQKLKL